MERLLTGSKGGKGDRDTATEQAERIWKMLDELAEENPEAYKKFVNNNIREGKEMFEPATAEFCVRTKLLASKDKLFINFCSYSHMKKPEKGGALSTMTGDILNGFVYRGERVSCVVVAFHPTVITDMRASVSEEKDIVCMAIRYLQDRAKVGISFEFVRHDEKFVGLQTMLSDMSRIMHGQKPVSRVPQVPDGVPTLEQVSRLARGDETTDSPESLFSESVSKPSKPLITELKSVPTPVSYEHNVVVREATGSKPKRAVFCAALPSGLCLADLLVDVSKNDIVIKVPSQPTLTLPWPMPVNDKLVSATFGTGGILTVKAPVL